MKDKSPSLVSLTIDGQAIEVEKDKTVLEAARKQGISIPSLCYHPALRPSGACRVCAVAVESQTGRQMIMLSCVLKVKAGMVVRTTGEAVDRARIQAFRKLLTLAPQAQKIRELAEAHGIDLGPQPDGCIRCRLCIRVCKEIVGPAALEMTQRDGHDFVTPIAGQCIGCGTCANLCPTGHIRLTDQGNVRTIAIRDEIIGQHPLQRCEGCGSLFATPRFLDHIQRRVAPHTDLKTHHTYCPTCSKLFSDRVRMAGKHK